MPRIKERYFPVAQKINRDPEIRQLKHELGVTGFSMWLQVLAETDGQKGLWKGSARDIGGVLAGVCESNSRGSARFLQWVTDRGWIVWQSGSAIDCWHGLIVAKFAKYHGSEIDEKIPDSKEKQSLPSEPSEPSEPYIKKDRNLSSTAKPKKTAFPENFNPSDGLRAWYSKQRVDDIEPHVEAFRDYHVSRASRFLDWEAAFRTWVRNIGRFNGKPQVQKEGELSDRIQRALRRGL